jgi:hypothetical protein
MMAGEGMTESELSSLLNPHQRRKLQVTLYLIEKGLDDMTHLLRGELPKGAMYETISHLTPQQETEMLALISQVKERIAALKEMFELEVKVDEVKAIMMGQLGSMWESLHNTRPRNLGGYGAVSPALFETLDPELLRIISLINDLEKTLMH